MKHFLLVFAFFLLGSAALHAQSKTVADLSVFPNPTSDYISVKDNSDAVGYITVFNLVGKKVKEFEFVKGEQYYVADLTKGMYLVQILDRAKHTLTTHKLDKR
ncbi:MAG: T9SS type A sorting domain-containing protein [Saprospiraceae bacterium]|nr:T9SS type A sorting domain-containing protein [Saprospiraceae bacterium]MCB0544637.1 T9SS type A sorting domain-containing protein [Saprospiraceae bacterium]MCB0577431.1 T9SS type A sorting domain-containing protein [Saprospiraceae bacterium]MCB9306948.1 T9SS type A sorting domain-containing protein [Lewinellaceae bacterium]MCB9354268.1 T9SS type A sorting domain-containing protein [Lewinellaceae bacterium]